MFAVTLGKNRLKESKMQIGQKSRELWGELYETGDFTVIAEKANTTPATIQRIVKAKKPYETNAPVKWVKVIDKFYSNRLAEIKKLKRA